MKVMSKKRSGLIWLAAFAFVVVLAGLTYAMFQRNADVNNESSVKEDTAMQTKESPEVIKEGTATGAVIKTGDSKYGPMLFDSRGQAIYIWEVEDSSTPECYGSCAAAWPPVLTDGKPVASGDVNGDLLGTTKRTDGTTQVMYNGHPLYFYANEKPGEVECHNIRTHGGLWWAIQPSGVRVK